MSFKVYLLSNENSFANPPWWVESKDYVQPTGKIKHFWTKGVRAGSRWPHTNVVWSSPDNYRFKDQLNYPYFLGMSASYAKKKFKNCEIFLETVLLCLTL